MGFILSISRRNGRDSGVFILRNGTFADGRAEVFGTTPVGNRSRIFRATLKKLAEN
jgi:hypothetical protein